MTDKTDIHYMTVEQIDEICAAGRATRWQGDGRQYDRDTARLVLGALARREVTCVRETLLWHRTADTMPPINKIVLGFIGPDADDPTALIEMVLWDGTEWRVAENRWPLGDGVTWWAAMPAGPELVGGV